MAKSIRCPICGKEGDWWEEAYGPFCSERCKLVDLGKWLGEEYVITEPLRPDHFAQYEELVGGAELDSPERDREADDRDSS